VLKVGLTGSIGSGKSTVAAMLAVMGVPVYPADDHAKRFLDAPAVRSKLISVFGNQIVDNEGKMNRSQLAALVFSDPEKLELLNQLIHPMVMPDFCCWAGLYASKPYVVMEAAVLLEHGYGDCFDYIMLVSAPEAVRKHRVFQRDGMNEKAFSQRDSKQWSDEVKAALCDCNLVNDGSQALLPQVLAVHQEIIDLI